MKTLCIIDVQTGYNPSKRLIGEIIKKIKLAKDRSYGIIVVEKKGKGHTVRPIVKAINMYSKYCYTCKTAQDGSGVIMEACRINKFATSNIEVCGLYRCHCIKRTVEGLLKKLLQCRIFVSFKATECLCERR